MKGQNKRLGLLRDKAVVHVREVFDTIQGEGPMSGMPATFVRLGGCNLACSFCDTDFELDKSPAQKVSDLAIQLADKFVGVSRLFVITGGEPLRQAGAHELARVLIHQGHTVQFETSGSAWAFPEPTARDRDPRMQWVVSPKTSEVARQVHSVATAWKYVVGTDATVEHDDGGWACIEVDDPMTPRGRVLLASPRDKRLTPVFVQPRDDGDPTFNTQNTAKAVAICLETGWRLGLQVHKIVHLP